MPILKELKKKLKEIYGKKLKGTILYNSYGKGEATEESDIDLIILLEDMKEVIAEREKIL